MRTLTTISQLEKVIQAKNYLEDFSAFHIWVKESMHPKFCEWLRKHKIAYNGIGGYGDGILGISIYDRKKYYGKENLD